MAAECGRSAIRCTAVRLRKAPPLRHSGKAWRLSLVNCSHSASSPQDKGSVFRRIIHGLPPESHAARGGQVGANPNRAGRGPGAADLHAFKHSEPESASLIASGDKAAAAKAEIVCRIAHT